MSEGSAIAPQASQLVAESMSFEEFLKRYDGQHAEWLVDKVLILVSNNLKHQKLLLFLTKLLALYLDFRPVGQLVQAAFSMYVGDAQPAREPDLLVVLNDHLERLKDT